MSFPEALLGYKGRATIGDVVLDVSLSESHSLEAETTDHPVEDGSDISDHYRKVPAPFQIDGIISNTPLSTGYPGQSAVNGITAAIDGTDPVKDTWETIKGYFDNGTILTITTSLDTYPSRVLVNFKVDRNNKSGQTLRFSCTAKYIKIVKTKETSAFSKVAKTATAGKQKSKKQQGRKPAKKAAEKKSSTAYKALFG